jgi:hypothetical protein
MGEDDLQITLNVGIEPKATSGIDIQSLFGDTVAALCKIRWYN